MNDYQTDMWNALSTLVENNEAFYHADRELDGHWYRLYNYRLASYSDFLNPFALECRGHTFEISHEGLGAEPIRLASLPMQKFHNVDECPFTMDLNFDEVVNVELKADGSLISTYMHDDILQLKTKGSLISDQAVDAKAWLNLSENKDFKRELLGAEKLGYTVNLEYCAPTNRIVIGYEEPHLTILNIRSREDGSYVDFNDIDTDHFPEILNRWIECLDIKDPVQFAKDISDMQGIEGYVLKFKNGQWAKQKTTWYLALHHTKDSINTPRRLYEAVLEEATDDMRSLFHDDPVAISMIENMEKFVEEKYNHLVDVIERYYERNKKLDRKEYAILGQKELDRKEFGLAMSKYVGKLVNYKDFMKKNWKYYNLSDENLNEEVN